MSHMEASHTHRNDRKGVAQAERDGGLGMTRECQATMLPSQDFNIPEFTTRRLAGPLHSSTCSGQDIFRLAEAVAMEVLANLGNTERVNGNLLKGFMGSVGEGVANACQASSLHLQALDGMPRTMTRQRSLTFLPPRFRFVSRYASRTCKIDWISTCSFIGHLKSSGSPPVPDPDLGHWVSLSPLSQRILPAEIGPVQRWCIMKCQQPSAAGQTLGA
ncbi:hypothetical protein GE09DRAFT_293247 [Coniochaeta sp. 2T2.1]|nr:hypothetical protein GE09DRAFT_293247 [Coniochaeta sp. 2T2.1]